MTIDDFIEEIGKSARRFRWVLVPDEGWHSERRAKARLLLRATSLGGSTLTPLAAVCRAKTGKLHAPESWRRAAEDLGLGIEDAKRIHAAANHATWKGPTGERTPDPDLEDLRARLIETVGLPVPHPEEPAD